MFEIEDNSKELLDAILEKTKFLKMKKSEILMDALYDYCLKIGEVPEFAKKHRSFLVSRIETLEDKFNRAEKLKRVKDTLKSKKFVY